MCFTIPKQLLHVTDSKGIIEGEIEVDVSGVLPCSVGDYIIVTSGIAVSKISKSEAQAMRSTIKTTYEELSNRD